MDYSELFDNYLEAMSEGSGYERGSAEFAEMMKQGISAEQQEAYMRSAGYSFIKSSDGTYSYIGKPTIDPPASDNAVLTNSNLQAGTSGAGTDGAYYEQAFGTQTTGETPTGKSTVSESATKVYKDGALTAGTKILGVAGKALSTVMAYNVGLNLGKVIDGALYDADPDFWDEKGMSTLDPDTWGQISQEIDNPAGRFAFNLLAGVRTDKDTGKTSATMYADADLQAYMARWLAESDVFRATQTELTDGDYDKSVVNWEYTLPIKLYNKIDGLNELGNGYTYQINDGYIAVIPSSAENQYSINLMSENPGTYTSTLYVNGIAHDPVTSSLRQHTVGGQVYYTANVDISSAVYEKYASALPNSEYAFNNAYLIYNGNVKTYAPPDGVNNQNGATIFNPSGLTSTADYKQALYDQYPYLYDNRLEYQVAQPDGSVKTFTYLPLPIADNFYQNTNQPIGDANTLYQHNYDYDGSGMTDTQIATILNWLTQNYPENQAKNLTDPKDLTDTKTPDNAQDTGYGNTPAFVPITGKASSLWAIYNPTITQLNSLGAWLWSSDFIDQILKLFSDPMQAIIGLHRVYATPATGGEQNIKVGYLDSGVSSKVVTDQYTTIDCGTIKCYEYFGNVFDYSPHTMIRIYLPFVGIVDLSVSDVMRSQIQVIYHVDVLSGACLAEIRVTRDSFGGTLYQFAGNASVTMPISSGSYIGVISNVVGVAARAVAGAAAGGPVGAIAGGVTGALSSRGGTEVQHSGGFSGNAGAMGIKKPYLIIERPQTEMAQNFQNLQGYGSNFYTQLSACSGYTQVKAVHVDSITDATQEEKEMIENALKSGVII